MLEMWTRTQGSKSISLFVVSHAILSKSNFHVAIYNFAWNNGCLLRLSSHPRQDERLYACTSRSLKLGSTSTRTIASFFCVRKWWLTQVSVIIICHGEENLFLRLRSQVPTVPCSPSPGFLVRLKRGAYPYQSSCPIDATTREPTVCS